MDVYEKTGFLKVTFNKEKKYVMFKWIKFGLSLESLKVAHQKALDILLANNCYNYIAETSQATGLLSQSVIEWWTNEWVPKLQKSGIKAIVTVIPSSVFATYSTKDWQSAVAGNIIMKNVASLEEAEAFLKTIE